MSDGNKRYLGDVWINEENLTRQREFFRDIIATYQYKNGGEFDASSLRGYIPSDFATAEQGILADNSLQAPLRLGRKSILNIDNAQYIYTDAVLIDQEHQCLSNTWFSDMTNSNVTDALCRVYSKVTEIQEELQDNIDNCVTTEEFKPVKDTVDEILEEFTDENGHKIRRFNAQLVNGLRFILITQQAYDALSDEDRNYWRNVFIIKDPADIPSTYEDPMQMTLTDGYSFQITNGGLYVKNGFSDEWKQICTLDELIASSNIEEIVTNIIDEYDYRVALNPNDVLTALMPISPSTINNNWQNYPFLSSALHDDFVNDITINGSRNHISATIDSNTRFKNVDIDMNSIIGQTKSEIINTITTKETAILGQISSLTSNVDNLILTEVPQLKTKNNSQDTIINGIQSQLTQIQGELNTLTNTVNSLNSTVTNELNNLGKWESVTIATYDENCLIGKVNKKLKLCSAIVNDVFSYTTKKKNTYIKTAERVVAAYRPIHNVFFSSSPYTVGKIDKDGYVYGKSIYGSDYNIDLHGSVMWRY